MTKTIRNSVVATEASFHKHYATIWGEERWHKSLYPALAERTRHASLVNRHVPIHAFFENVEDTAQLERISLPSLLPGEREDAEKILLFTQKIQESTHVEAAASHKQVSLLPQPRLASTQGSSQRLFTHYNLDAVSVLVAHLLDVRPGHNVLDLCAAPGGKSISLAQDMWPHRYESKTDSLLLPGGSQIGHLTSNESDPSRHKRLSENLQSYLPAQLFDSKNVSCLQVDGTDPLAAQKLCIGSRGYDKVLVDAPCSSERHIIHAHTAAKAAGRVAPEMANWRSTSSKRLVEMQAKLVMTGLRAAKMGASVLYATCSIEIAENDGVIEKVLALMEKERKKGSVNWGVKIGFNGGRGNDLLEAELLRDWAEKTKYGWIVLPDHPSGGKWGPLFFVKLTKVELPR